MGAILAVSILTGGDDGHDYTLMFETGGQLVPGNEVLVAGQAVGTIDSIDLTDDGQAAVKVTLDEPLITGSTAQIRSTSLSGIANRYIALQMGPESDDTLPDGATLSADATSAPVDIDQLFSIFDDRTRKSLQKVIAGQATIYAGDPAKSRAAYKYLSPGLQSTDRLLRELTRDQQVFSEFLTGGARILGAVAERRDDLSQLTENANIALSAIAAENDSLDRTLAALPPTMRQANTTFVNLRAALDDLDPLVETSIPATKNLAPFLRDLRPVASRAVPVIGDLRRALNRSGPDNDLSDFLEIAPEVSKKGRRASSSAIKAMNVSEQNIAVTRAYSPDLIGLLAKLGQASATYDSDGHYARLLPITNTFEYNDITGELDPTYNQPQDYYDFFTTTPNAASVFGYQRCPGAATPPAADLSNPFLDDGNLNGLCDPSDVPLGP